MHRLWSASGAPSFSVDTVILMLFGEIFDEESTALKVQ